VAENLKQTIEFQAKGIAKLKKQYKELERRTKGLEGATNKAGGSLGGLIAKLGLTTVALYGAMRAISSVVRVGTDFEKKMSNVAAISGAVGGELLALEQNARQLGATTVFTASQVAELQTEFAKLGFTSAEIRGVTKDTLALAAASGSDLATSAAVAGQTLRAFGLDVSETSRVTDTMALSFSRSALDMDKFTNSMQYVAPVAKAVGFNVEGTTALLGALANAGISGSLAGTALRTVFLKLADSNSALSKRLGGSVKSADELIPALKKLSDSGVDLTEVLGLVDKRAVSAFNILLEGTDDMAELKDELDNAAGAAQRMADVQLDNLAGSMTLLNSAMEGFAVSLFDNFSEPMRGAVDSLTSLVTALNSWIEMPTSEKIEEDLMASRDLFAVIKDLGATEETRANAIDTLNAKYGEYLPNLIDEKSKLEDIEEAQLAIVNTMLQKIALAVNEEEIAKTVAKMKGLRREEADAILEVAKVEEELLTAQTKQTEAAEALREKNKKLSASFSTVASLQQDQILTAVNYNETQALSGTTTHALNQELLNSQERLNANREAQENLRNEVTKLNAEAVELAGSLTAVAVATGEVSDETEDGADAEDKSAESKEKSLEASLKGVAMSRDLESASKSLAKQYVVEGVFDAVKSAITSIPFPFNLAAAATAAAAANALFSAVVPAATGFEGVVDRPTMFMTGEGNKKEHVSVTPLEAPNINGPQGGGITVNISGGIIQDDYIRNTLVPALNKANSMGA